MHGWIGCGGLVGCGGGAGCKRGCDPLPCIFFIPFSALLVGALSEHYVSGTSTVWFGRMSGLGWKLGVEARWRFRAWGEGEEGWRVFGREEGGGRVFLGGIEGFGEGGGGGGGGAFWELEGGFVEVG